MSLQNKVTFNEKSHYGPSLSALDTSLFLTWTDTDHYVNLFSLATDQSGDVSVSQKFYGHNFQQLQPKSSAAPCVMSVMTPDLTSSFCMAWLDKGKENIYLSDLGFLVDPGFGADLPARIPLPHKAVAGVSLFPQKFTETNVPVGDSPFSWKTSLAWADTHSHIHMIKDIYAQSQQVHKVANISTSHTPGDSHGQYMAWTGADDQVYIGILQGNEIMPTTVFAIPGAKSSKSPAIVNMTDIPVPTPPEGASIPVIPIAAERIVMPHVQFIVAWKGLGDDNNLYACLLYGSSGFSGLNSVETIGGSNHSLVNLGVQSNHSPALTLCKGRVYVAWTDMDNKPNVAMLQ